MNGDSALHWAAYKGFPGLMQVYFRRFGGFSIATFFVLLELINWRICRLFLACFDSLILKDSISDKNVLIAL